METETRNWYQNLIHKLDPTVNPAGVEASMRLQFGVLDHLDEETFEREIEIAVEAEKWEPGYLRNCASTYALGPAFDWWERKLAGRLDYGR